MAKVQTDPKVMFHPRPTFLVGANVDGKPNFMVACAGGGACGDPPMISVSLQHPRYTLRGIRQNMTFSVNLPSAAIAREFDYCGLVSGAQADKVSVCKFKVFFGTLGNAPMVEQCPVNQECKVEHILNLGSHALIIGRIVQTHVSEDCLTGGKPDLAKINTLVYTQARQYLAFGPLVAEAYNIGKQLIK